MPWKVEELSEYDMRRPVTPTGTNLLGLVKHLAGLEFGYLGDAFGRTSPGMLPWVDDGSIWDRPDMWAKADETSDDIIGGSIAGRVNMPIARSPSSTWTRSTPSHGGPKVLGGRRFAS